MRLKAQPQQGETPQRTARWLPRSSAWQWHVISIHISWAKVSHIVNFWNLSKCNILVFLEKEGNQQYWGMLLMLTEALYVTWYFQLHRLPCSLITSCFHPSTLSDHIILSILYFIIMKPIILDVLFIVYLSPSTPTNVRIRGTETWSILFYLSLFIPRAWDIPVLNLYLMNELVNGFCLKLGNPEK